MDLALTNVIDISVSATQNGIGDYNTSNIALFSDEPFENTFGSDGFKIYLSPQDVGTDFGTDSRTYDMANRIFSQKPNILAGNGYLVVIPFVTEIQNILPDGVPASGTVVLDYGIIPTAAINWDDTAAEIQAKLRAIPALAGVLVTGTLATQIDVDFKGVYGNATLLTVGANSLQTAGLVAVNLAISTTTTAEDIAAAITRTEDLVQYFGVIQNVIIPQADMLAAAVIIQALNKVAGFVSRDPASVEVGGMIDLLRSGGYTQSRGLFYGSGDDASALAFLASYFGRGLSTNFEGNNTTQTMHLKDLATMQPDPSMTQTLLNKCKAAGADVYISLQGVAKVFCSGKNQFFDQVYNLQWFIGALQVAGFNFLAQSSTKIPQTEGGMLGLKGAYRAVCEQGVVNQYGAPGEWQSSTTFGNQGDFLANISQRGYYIFSQPIGNQSPTARAARQAPLIQIAFKEAGAIHSSSVLVNINA